MRRAMVAAEFSASFAFLTLTVLDAIANTRHRVVYPLPNFPQLVLEASEDTLRALGSSPHVLKIQEPTLSRPMR